MSGEENTTISDKLFDLCEKQLLSIINDAGLSISKISRSTSSVVEDSTQLIEMIGKSNQDNGIGSALGSNLEDSVNGIIVNMQFFDELSQRIEHIMEIVNLIKLESSREDFLSDPQISKELLDDVKNIFSIRSEFEVMKNIFPEYGEIDNSKTIELF